MKSIQGYTDSYYSLKSNKTLSHEIGSLGWLPGDNDVIQKTQTYPNYDVIDKKTKIQNFLIFFVNYKTFQVFREFEQTLLLKWLVSLAFAQIGQVYLFYDFIEKPKILFEP